MKFSPLFWPVQLKGNTIYVLDETKLPNKLIFIKVKNYKQTCLCIKNMKTRAVGQIILVFCTFLLVVRENRKRKNIDPLLENVAKAINATRPTFPFKFLTDMILGWAKDRRNLEKNILGFLKGLKNARTQQAKEASEFLKNADTILTHCNVSGSLSLMAQFARRDNKQIKFFVSETRPYLQGSRLTAWELKRAGFSVTIIPDSAVAHVFSQGLVNKVIVGADHMARNGDIANKIGTYQIAVLAKKFGIPFYVLTPPASKTKTGRDIRIEIRPDKELLTIQGRRIAPTGVKGYYPAFDITPKSLITKHITLKV